MTTRTLRFLISGILGLALVATTTGAAVPSGASPPPVTAVTPESKQATVTWKQLNRTVNKTSTYVGLQGTILYVAPTGASGSVEISVSSLKPGTTTWVQVTKANISPSTRSYELYVQDVNHNLSSGAVTYRVEAKVSAPGTKVGLPANFSVDYTKSATTITSGKLVGKTLSTDSLYPFTVTGKINSSVLRKVYVQRYDATKRTWNDVNYTYAYPAKAFTIPLPQTKATETYRTYVPADLSQTAYSGPATVVKRTSPKGQFYSMLVQKSRIVPWETNTANVYVMSRLVEGESVPNVTLQGIVGKQWKNITSIKKQGRITFTLPKGTTSSNNVIQTYRYVVNGTKYSDTGISSAFTVRWENPRKYTGYRLTAYNYASRYCPNMMIDVKTLPKGVAGLAYMGSDVTALSPTIAARHLRTVSLHECAHHRQWSLYKSGFESFKTKMGKLYNTSGKMGVEYNADCVANVWYKNSYWGYGRGCSGQQLVAARMIAAGKKY